MTALPGAAERIRIESSGQLEMYCDFCAVTGRWMIDMYTGKKSWQPREPCCHPGYYLEYQCRSCRYRCHSPKKAKEHSNTGHKIMLVRIYWRIEQNVTLPEND